MRNLFIWSAGSDKSILSKCSDTEIIKHVGYGTLVIVPAVLAFISMTYALSTLDILKDKPQVVYYVSIFWGLTILSFDRFVVSTHRRKTKNLLELKNPSFILRFIFALVLGIAISHPLVLLWFDGSIEQEIIKANDAEIKLVESEYQNTIDSLSLNLQSLKNNKQCMQKLLTAEQSGEKLNLPCGSSSGLPTYGKRAAEIKDIIKDLDIQIIEETTLLNERLDQYKKIKDDRLNNLEKHLSFDYLKRELALEKIKEGNSIVVITQYVIILLFVLIDLLPVTFKTFAPFGMYDKILHDDSDLLKEMDTRSRKQVLQKAYDKISKVYAENKGIDKTPEEIKQKLLSMFSIHRLQRNIVIGLFISSIFIFSFIIYDNYYKEQFGSELSEIFWFSSFFLPLFMTIIGGYIMEYFKLQKVKS